MNSNTKLKYVKLDCDFFGKAKQKALLVDHGAEAILYLLRIYALLAATSTGKITISAALGCAFDIGVGREQAKALLTIFTTPDSRNPEEGTLLELRDEVVFLSRIIEDQTEVSTKRERDAERLRQVRDKDATSVRQTERKRGENIATPYNYNYSSSLSSNSGKGGPGENQTAAASPNAADAAPNSKGPAAKADRPAEANRAERGASKPEPETDDERWLRVAQTYLDEPNGQDWTRTNAHMNSGKRPLKKFPKLFFTGTELSRVLRDFRESQIPDRLIRKGFELLESQVTTQKDRGMPDNSHAVSLQGWIKGALLKELDQEERLKRTRSMNETAGIRS